MPKLPGWVAKTSSAPPPSARTTPCSSFGRARSPTYPAALSDAASVIPSESPIPVVGRPRCRSIQARASASVPPVPATTHAVAPAVHGRSATTPSVSVGTGYSRDGATVRLRLQSPRVGIRVGMRSGARMRAEVRLAHVVGRDVRVHLRRLDRGVAEHLLDASQVGAALDEMRGEGVPQGVRRHVLL